MSLKLSTTQAHWKDFLVQNEGIKFVWVQFTTYMGTNHVRMVTVSKFTEMVESGQNLSLPQVVLHLLPHDKVATEGSLTGSVFLKPDLTTIYCRQDLTDSRAVLISWWVDKEGSPIAQCARSKLHNLSLQVLQKTGFSILLGFEVELIFMKRKFDNDHDEFEATNTEHSWSSMTASDEKLLPVLEEIMDSLQKLDIQIEQFHAEIAPGQWEFVLPPASPLEAVDCLVTTRQTIMSVAQRHGLRATLHPRPFPDDAGTGSHVHISLNSEQGQDLWKTESFFAGVLEQFPAIAAFTLPHEISYCRVQPGISSGGLYVAWGRDNRETILRRMAVNRFEIKMMDGLANPYLALCAILAAGLNGMVTDMALVSGDCKVPPSSMSEHERQAMGIKEKIPQTLEGSLATLEGNEVLRDLLGDSMVSTYIAVKRGEMKELNAMTPTDRRNWLISNF